MGIIKLRKKQISILELLCVTAWVGIGLYIFLLNFLWGITLALWSISFLITWFFTNSKWSIFQALFAGTFCISQTISCCLVIGICFSSTFSLTDGMVDWFLIGTPILGAIIGGIVGSYLHLGIVDRNQDA